MVPVSQPPKSSQPIKASTVTEASSVLTDDKRVSKDEGNGYWGVNPLTGMPSLRRHVSIREDEFDTDVDEDEEQVYLKQ